MSRLEARQWQTMLSQSWSPRQWYDDEQRPDTNNLTPGEQRIMWVYRKEHEGLWAVGYYTPDKEWVPDSGWNTADQAARRVRWLNGGND